MTAVTKSKSPTLVDQTMHLMQISIERGASPEEITALMELRRELQEEYTERQFHKSKSRFLTALPIIKKRKEAKIAPKNGGVPYVYHYASLEDIVETIKPYLELHGFSYRWVELVTPEGMINVTCILTHTEGHQEMCSMTGMLDQSGGKNAIQMLGSTSTYLRRYTLTGVMGIATADEDIDGRLPELITSNTLTNILNEGEKEAAEIMDHIAAAKNLEQLKDVGNMIKDMTDGPFKETCKIDYFGALKRFQKEEVADV